MTQSKGSFTPGPWRQAVAEEPDSETIVGQGYTVATVWGGFPDRPANARLIAAAPALLEALPDLSSVIAWLDNGCDPKHAADELRIYQRRIDAAIHSATGEG